MDEKKNQSPSGAAASLSPEHKKLLEERVALMPPELRVVFQQKIRTMSAEDLKAHLDSISKMTPEEHLAVMQKRAQEKRAGMSPEEMEQMSRSQERARLMREKAQASGKPNGPGGMGKGVSKPKNAGASFRRLLAYLGRRKSLLLGGLAAAIVSTLFALAAPQILSASLNRLQVVVQNHIQLQYDKVLMLLTALGGIYLLNMVFAILASQLFARATQETLYQMRKDVDHKLMKLPFSYFDSVPKGDILSRMSNDIDNIGTSLQQSMSQFITSLLTIVGSLAMMFHICWWLTLLCLITVPCGILVSRSIMKRSQALFREQWKHVGSLNAMAEEIYSGANVVRGFGFEADVKKAFGQTTGELYEASRKAQFFSSMVNPVATFFNNIAYILICAFGAANVLRGTMNLGNITALLQYQKMYSTPVTQITTLLNGLQSALASAERVFELLDQQEETQKEPVSALSAPVKGDIRFQHLRFGYTPDRILMHDIDVTVKAGQMVAIVGPTGAGKTTLVNLLMRFYEPNGGSISIDGVDISGITREDLRSQFGMVLQETWLFNGSIRDNISYGREQVSEEEMLTAAKSARIDHFVNTFEQGYDMVINEDASNISQGQKQLITIARAMIANPTVLILDEATSSVDTRTEAVIQQAMNNLLKGRTSFVIAHRLSTIRNADLILVMKNGDIVEQGTHDSLMEQNGLYADLYLSQFAHS